MRYHNKTKNRVFKIVESMTQAEKRYFKIFASRHTIGNDKNKCVELFDILDKQKKYDQLFTKNELFIATGTRNFSETKYHLSSLLSKSLCNFHLGNSIENKLGEIIIYSDILYKKKLIDESLIVLSKGEAIARKSEKNFQLIEILDKQRKIIIENQPSIKKFFSSINTLTNEIDKTYKTIRNIEQYKRLSVKFFEATYSAQRARSAKDMDRVRALMENLFLKKPSKAICNYSRFLFFHINSIYGAYIGNINLAYKHALKCLEVMEKIPDEIRSDMPRYIKILSSTANYQVLLGLFDELTDTINKMESLVLRYNAEVSIEIEIFIFERTCYFNLLRAKKLGAFSEALVGIKKVEEKLQLYQEKMSSNTITLLFDLLSQIYFGAGKYSNALFWSNKTMETTDIREDIKCYARIFNLIIHYEIGNTENIPYFIKSTHRFLNKKEKLFRFEKLILTFIKKALPDSSQIAMNGIYKKLKHDLEQLLNDKQEKSFVTDYFDFISWVESKMKKCSFAAMVQEKSLHHRNKVI